MIPDQFSCYEDLAQALRDAGVERTQLVVGVDFTQSNMKTGRVSFNGKCLHDVSDPDCPNPYMQALNIIAKALWDFDDDHLIPVYGFGDKTTEGEAVFSFTDDDRPCKGLVQCEQRYKEIANRVSLYGPTSFAPVIRQGIKLVRETWEYHFLLIIADGQVSKNKMSATVDAIVEASSYAMSIVMVGVGDGPWHVMEQFDDDMPRRVFDNFQFVDFNTVFTRYPEERRETAFATHALMELPEQYQAVKALRLLDSHRRMPPFDPPSPPLNPP